MKRRPGLGWAAWLLLLALALAGAGCDTSSDDDSSDGGGDGGGGTVDSDTGVDISSSVQSAMGSAMDGEGATTTLSAVPAFPGKALQAMAGLPGFRIPGGVSVGDELYTNTATYTFDGEYECEVSGTVGASGSLTDTQEIELEVSPYYFSDQYSTTDPIQLTLNACSDGIWVLDGGVQYVMGTSIYLETTDLVFFIFDYTYDESFDADVTGTEVATDSEASAEMSWDLTGEASGTIDGETETVTYDTFEWTISLTVNGDSYTCTVNDPEAEEATCQ
jgi:hypothetical protein